MTLDGADLLTLNSVLRLPRTVVFGSGARHVLSDALREYGTSVFLCTDENVVASPMGAGVVEALESAGFKVRIFKDIVPELPLSCVEAAVAEARSGPVDVIVAIGGGSSIDLAKVVAISLSDPGPVDRFYGENMLRVPAVPVVAVPTTAGTGSEVTPVAVVADPNRALKVGISDPHIIPSVAVCDPDLTLTCPPSVTGFSGADALVHAVEGFCAPQFEHTWPPFPGNVFRGRNEITRQYSIVALQRIARSLERAYRDGTDLEARTDMLFGSLCAGISFGHAGTAAAHALQYPVGAATGTPHGLGVGLLLPFTLENTRPEVDASLIALAPCLDVDPTSPDLAGAVIDELARLVHAVGVPESLADIGVDRADLPRFARDGFGVARLIRNAPRVLSEADCLVTLEAAWEGERSLAAQRR